MTKKKTPVLPWDDYLPVLLKQIGATHAQRLTTASEFEALLVNNCNVPRDVFSNQDGDARYRMIGFLNERTRCWYYLGWPAAREMTQNGAPYLKSYLPTQKGRAFLALYMSLGVVPPIPHAATES